VTPTALAELLPNVIQIFQPYITPLNSTATPTPGVLYALASVLTGAFSLE
jgi:hypothetical protein